MAISSCGAVKACRTIPLASTSKAREPPVPISRPSQNIEILPSLVDHCRGAALCNLKRQVGRAEQARFIPEDGLLDLRVGAGERKRALSYLLKHRGSEEIPGRQHSPAEQIERKIKDVDQIR